MTLQPALTTGYAQRRSAVLAEVAAVTAITILAAFLRLIQLDVAPPGLYHDEAINGVLGDYIIHGNRSLFFGEREALFMYFLAEAIKTFGQDVTSLRVVSALFGTATVPALYLATRLMFDRRVALLASLGLAASYWHLSISRTVFRAITLPFFETLAVLFLWAALRRTERWSRLALFVLAGVFLGAVLYTYIAGRMVPVVLLVFLLAQVVFDRQSLKPIWANLAVYVAAAAVVFWPLGIFYWANPEGFMGRMGEVALAPESQASGIAGYLQNVLHVAGMFFVAGDQNWRHNLGGLPVFDPVFGVGFLVGSVLCLVRWRRPEARFLILWAGAMLVPTLLAADAPHYLRAIGALPALCIIAALGLVWLGTSLLAHSRRLAPFLAKRRGYGTFLAFAGAMAVLSATYSSILYFGVWLNSAQAFLAFDGPLAAAGRYLTSSPAWQASAAGKHDYFLTTRFWQDRTAMLFYLWPRLAGRDRDDMGATRLGSRWLDEDSALPLRPDGATYLLADADSWAAEQLRQIYGQDGLSVETPPASPTGAPPFVVLTAGKLATGPSTPPLASFGNALTLGGYTLPASVVSGEEIDLVTRWQIGDVRSSWRDAGDKITVFVHLLDADDSPLVGASGLAYPPVDWQAGESLVLRHRLPLPPGTAPGTYRLLVGLIGPDGERVVETVGNRPDRTVLLPETLQVTPQRQAQQVPTLNDRVDMHIDGRLSLLGLAFPAGDEVSPGESLSLTLYWQALADVKEDYEVTLHVLGEDGREVGSGTDLTALSQYPTSRWQAGELVCDPRKVFVDPRAEGGVYRLTLTAKNRQTGALTRPQDIGQIRVLGLDRVFTTPAMQTPLSVPANFGNTAELLGYDLAPDPAAGVSLEVTLYWRCRSESDQRYKVFVHVLSPQGSLVAQSDAEPVGGGRPLTTWVEGEIVADGHTIPLPADLAPAAYPLEVGLYAEVDGKRLPLLGADSQEVDSRLLLPPVDLPASK
ncbi:MAG: phospholipid carrier-dependent glycosyltransferase [Dehalococcoidales bacterium]|nr:phospholipid carrier-dependent glycosyltransferase [Dehalococcoidales bacterium]